MTAPTTRWRSVVPGPRSGGRHRTSGSGADGSPAAPPNGADDSAAHAGRPGGQVPSMGAVGLGGVPGARVAGRYRLTRPAPAHAAARHPVPGQLWLAHDEILGRPVLVRLLPCSDPAADSLLGAARRAARLVDQGALAVLDASVGRLTPPEQGPSATDPAGQAPGGPPADRTDPGAPVPNDPVPNDPVPNDPVPTDPFRSDPGHSEVVYVVGEWVQAVDLATLLAQGPLPGREAARIAGEVARVLGHAHDEGLAHRQVVPEDVLVTDTGRVALAGLGVEAALHGQDETATEEARLADLRAAGAVLYAGLTARWPLESSRTSTALPAAPREGLLPCSPRQVRAAVPTELDELACRALGATRRGHPPVGSADELAGLLERAGSSRTGAARTGAAWTGGHWHDEWDAEPVDADRPDDQPTGPWPVVAESRRTVGAAAAVVGTVLAAGVGLLAWQILAPADSGPRVLAPNPGAAVADEARGALTGEGPVPVVAAHAFDPQGDGHEDDSAAALAVDGDVATAWTTQTYFGSPHLGGLKDGVGLVVDLGSVRDVRTVGLDLVGRGTDLQVRAAVVPAGTGVGAPGPASPPARLDGFPVLLGAVDDTGSSVAVRAPEPVSARYLLVWLTALPPTAPPGSPSPDRLTADAPPGAGGAAPVGQRAAYRGGVAEVRVSGPDPTAR